MCSIGGFITKNKGLSPEVASRLAASLLHHGTDRGSQSGGTFTWDGVRRTYLKQAVHPTKVSKHLHWGQLFTRPVEVCFTHTRMPTCGGRGDAQAQPFWKGKTVCVHNGWYANHLELREVYELRNPSGVDSELVREWITRYGIDALPHFITETEGPSAIAMWDNGEVYLTRSGNPLCYVQVPNIGLVFASTPDILCASLEDIGIRGIQGEVKELEERYVWKVSSNGALERYSKRIDHPYYDDFGLDNVETLEFTDSYDELLYAIDLETRFAWNRWE